MKRAFAAGAAWTAAAAWIEQAASVVVFLLIARLVGAEAVGIAAMALAFVFLGEFLVRDTLTESVVERPSLEDGRLEATLVALLGFALVIVAALVVISRLAAALYGEPSVAPLMLTASPTVLLIAASGVSTALLRRRMAFRALAVRTIVAVAAGGAVGVTMAANGLGAWSLVGQRLTQVSVTALFTITAAGWAPRRLPRRAELALVRGLGPQVVLLRAMSLVIVQTPTVALGAVADPRAVGLFSVAWRLTEIVGFVIVGPLKGAAQPAVAAMRRMHASTAQFFIELSEVAALAAFAAFAGLALIAAPAAAVLVGPEWREAGAVLPILCIAGAVYALTSIQEAYLLALDRPARYVAATTMEAVIGAVLVALASPFGPVAAAAAVALRALAFLPLRTAAALAPEAIPPVQVLRALAVPALAAAGMAMVVAAWRAAILGRVSDILFVTTAVAFGVATFLLLLFGLAPGAVARLRSFVQTEP